MTYVLGADGEWSNPEVEVDHIFGYEGTGFWCLTKQFRRKWGGFLPSTPLTNMDLESHVCTGKQSFRVPFSGSMFVFGSVHFKTV